VVQEKRKPQRLGLEEHLLERGAPAALCVGLRGGSRGIGYRYAHVIGIRLSPWPSATSM
jgi:hypothetical protein